MFKIDTLHVTFQLSPRDVELGFKDLSNLHELCSMPPLVGLIPFGSNVFTSQVFIEKCKALHGYEYGYAIVLKDWLEDTQTYKSLRLGSIFYGGNNNRPFLQFNGEGCKLLDFTKLYEVINVMFKSKITRCDIAYDDLLGQYGSMLDVAACYTSGQFKRNGKNPSVSQCGDWLSSTDTKGRTLYVGARTGACMMRIYEKGKELGIIASPWIRYEIEYKANDYYIPFDILLSPASYFVSLNLHNSKFSVASPLKLSHSSKLVDTLENEALWAHRVKYAKLQAGAVLFEHLAKEGGDLGSLVSFAKSSKLKRDPLDKSSLMCDNVAKE